MPVVPSVTFFSRGSGPAVAQPEPDCPLDAKVSYLRRPDAYRFDHTRQVEVIETRLSWVFLTERHAFKLKKPRQLPELDLSTVALRRANCLTEIRLNRRLAPTVYHDALCLALQADGALRLCVRPKPTDMIVDWVVWMQRLPTERRMDELIRAETLLPSDIRALSATLWRFYRFSPPVPISTDRYLGRFRQAIEKNQEAVRSRLPKDMVERASESAIRQRTFLKTQRILLQRRVVEQRIIEGHGDLRPEHVFLETPPKIIDCLEFDRTLRLLDPIDELSYLGLECDRLGAGWIGDRMLKSYMMRSGDHPDFRLIAFYRAFRACTRIRLAACRLDDATAIQREHWLERIDRYLACIEKH